MTPAFWSFLGALLPLLWELYQRAGGSALSPEEEHAIALRLIRAAKDAQAAAELR